MIQRSATRTSAGVLATLALALSAPSLSGQATPIRVDEDVPCRRSDDRDRYCEVREYVLEPRAELAVDAGPNGGIAVEGWDRDEIRLIARVQAVSRAGDSRSLARAVEIRTGASIQADGPRTRDRDEWWSVSYELRVPHAIALRLDATNGGIDLEGLTGSVEARTTNGGLHLTGGAGRVRGETTNGGIHLALTGQSWRGPGVELRTTNGGVEIEVPAGYSAELETGTVNGAMRLDIPVTVQGRIDRRIRTRLGEGGPLIRAVTTNGGVVVTR